MIIIDGSVSAENDTNLITYLGSKWGVSV